MEGRSGYHRIEEEASYVPIEAEVEQSIQGDKGIEQEQLTGTQQMEKAIIDLGRGSESQGQTTGIGRGQGFSEQQSVQQGNFRGRGTGGGCFQCRREGHQKKDCPVLKAEECYYCHQLGHRKRDCPMLTGVTSVGSVAGSGRGFALGSSSRGGKGVTSGSQAQGRVFAMTLQDAQATPEVVTGTLSILDRNVIVLIDPGFTYSFVALSIAMHLGRPLSSLDSKLFISTPMREVVMVANEYRDCVLQMEDRQLKIPGEPEFIFIGERNVIPNCLISAIQTRKLLKKGCQGYLAYTVDIENKDVKVEDVPVVREFTDVFLEELSGLLVDREVDFTIKLVPGTVPIYITPYRMAPTELKELKVQLQDVLDKGFI
ncbi:uncharacterized protein LOC132270571 [Cornus florida]|uniref:uncharacterized protein LOC132270571 n=1 Tax=Cornus florida TaxID=4283 RepID=UPI0028A10F7B|nr:uncharacterized protein LOC132270571 [Cornus florida]